MEKTKRTVFGIFGKFVADLFIMSGSFFMQGPPGQFKR